MKTFTATHLNKHAQEVFAAANEDGSVIIKHDRYPYKEIIITSRELTTPTPLDLQAELDGDFGRYLVRNKVNKDGGC